ncbi:hypothetical protein CAPTEDRAFT_167063 [Capitella teleta]|uniref:Cornifelin n=1 Tax=Capitella teleta TaxID=283909 RepID=R7UB63_CAPTE|nr:hypothetical protein CAPTEDRAFT_167063 [Capitella teleta]|eukprot:ELU00487.1 hypothetical protein CAPTEDRAFT_167063 [Capitella teleta]
MDTNQAVSYGYDQPPPGNPPSSAQYMTQQPMQMPPLAQTTVLVQPQQVQVNLPQSFSTGLCACFDDMEICCLGTFVPCVLGCQLADAMNESCCVANCLAFGLMGMRVKTRMQYNIGGTICSDWCTDAYCGLCVKCQLARELRAKGAM